MFKKLNILKNFIYKKCELSVKSKFNHLKLDFKLKFQKKGINLKTFPFYILYVKYKNIQNKTRIYCLILEKND